MSHQHCSSTPDYNQLHEPAPPAYTPPPHAISTPNADPDDHAPTTSSTSATTYSNGGSKVPVNSFMYFCAHAVDMLCKKGLHHALFAIARDIWNEQTSEEKQWWKDRLDEANARCLLETGRDIVGQVSLYRIANLNAAKIAAPVRVEERYSWYVSHPPPIKPRTKGKKSAKTRPERSSLQSGDHAPSNARHATQRRRRSRASRGVLQSDSDGSRLGSPASVQSSAQAGMSAGHAPQSAIQPLPSSFSAADYPISPDAYGHKHLVPSVQVYSPTDSLAAPPSLHAQGQITSVDELERRLLLDDASVPYLYDPYAPQQTVPTCGQGFPYAAAYRSDHLYLAESVIDPYRDLQLLDALQVQGCLVQEPYPQCAQDYCYDDGACNAPHLQMALAAPE